jgi:hypothetical protein
MDMDALDEGERIKSSSSPRSKTLKTLKTSQKDIRNSQQTLSTTHQHLCKMHKQPLNQTKLRQTLVYHPIAHNGAARITPYLRLSQIPDTV